MFEKITEAEINERSMANVSTTPNRPTAFGESKMDAQALKLRFDRLSRYLAGRINEIFAGMSDGNLAKNVKIVEEKGEETIEYSLAEFILKMIEGDLTQINVKVPEGTQRLDVICNQVLRWQNEIKTGDFADETVVVTGVTIRQFYEEFKKLEETGQGKPGEPGKSAYDYAVEGGYQGTEEEFAKKLATDYPSKVSQLENDEKYITASGAPVQSVNGKAGAVILDHSSVGAEKSGTAATLVSGHNVSTEAHNDLRLELQRLAGIIADVFDSDDTTLDEMHEIVAVIKENKTIIEAITTNKVSVSDIIDNLTTSISNKPLSAKQGVALKALIDAIKVPTKLSDLENDKGFITDLAEEDPTVPSWAKAPSKPGYTKNEVGLGNVDNVRQYSASNPPPYPVKSVNDKTGNVELTATDVGARPEDWMPTASDVGARPATWMPSYSDVGAEKAGNVAAHNTNTAAHNDLRILIQGLTDRINAVLDSDDTTLDELSEIVTYIKANKTLIESVTTNKVNVSDIIDNLETPDPTKPLSAAQGVYIMVLLQQLVTEFGAALETRANKEQGVFFIKGSGTTAGTWLGVCAGIEAYYDGLMIAYKVGVAGASTTTLNINGLGAVKVVKNNNTGISTSFAVNSVIFLVYTVDGSTAYWKAHDYDANTRNSVGDYQKNNTKLYLVGTTTTDSETSSSYATSYTNSKCYVGANNRLYSNDEVVPNTAEIEALIETKLGVIENGSY